MSGVTRKEIEEKLKSHLLYKSVMWHGFVIACISAHLISKTEFVTSWKTDKEKKRLSEAFLELFPCRWRLNRYGLFRRKTKGKVT